MALKNQKTTSDYLEWDKLQSLVLKLERDGENKFALLISCGSFLGLRVSDLLQLRWNQLIGQSSITLAEKKTGKERVLHIHQDLQTIVQRHFKLNNPELSEYVFVNRFGSKPINVQYINAKLKEINKKYRLGIQFSSHTMRKSFGRRIWENNSCNEKALILLGSVFNHSSVSVTKAYLGIRSEEIASVYLSL
jgi:integrase